MTEKDIKDLWMQFLPEYSFDDVKERIKAVIVEKRAVCYGLIHGGSLLTNWSNYVVLIFLLDGW